MSKAKELFPQSNSYEAQGSPGAKHCATHFVGITFITFPAIPLIASLTALFLMNEETEAQSGDVIPARLHNQELFNQVCLW